MILSDAVSQQARGGGLDAADRVLAHVQLRGASAHALFAWRWSLAAEQAEKVQVRLQVRACLPLVVCCCCFCVCVCYACLVCVKPPHCPCKAASLSL
jgi:hypothetical protein